MDEFFIPQTTEVHVDCHYTPFILPFYLPEDNVEPPPEPPPFPPWRDAFGGYSYAQLRYIEERAAEYAAYTRIDLGRPFTKEEREKAFSWAYIQAERDFEDAGWNLQLVKPVERHAIKPRNKNLSTCQKIKLS